MSKPSPASPSHWSDQLLAATTAARQRVQTFASAEREKLARWHLAFEQQTSELNATLTALAEHEDHELNDLRAEREILVARVAQLDTELEHASARIPSADTQAELENLRNKYELALGDLRDLRRRNSELEQRVAEASNTPVASDDALDWESQKRRMLASLDALSEVDKSADGAEERLTIDGTIRITDSVVAEKEREISELKRLLEDQSRNVGSLAVGAAALEQIFDGDEIIRQERDRLAQLQAVWEDKLRGAELEVSRERARLARERAELEELRIRLPQESLEPPASADSSGGKKAPGGRWLNRLGLGGP